MCVYVRKIVRVYFRQRYVCHDSELQKVNCHIVPLIKYRHITLKGISKNIDVS